MIYVLSADDVGHRVVVRRVVGVRDGRPLMTDLLGELTSFEADYLTIETKAGAARVPLTDVVAGKRIPPKPQRPGR